LTETVSPDPRHAEMARALRRMRFLGSFAFGNVAAVRILQLDAAGVSATQIGLLMAGYSVVVAAVEIPSGAVADVFGRRRTKLIALAFLVAAFAVFAVVDDVVSSAVALTLLALGRALASGPMESWFVDEVGDANHPSVLGGLSSAEAAHNVGTALGAVTGGLLPWLLADSVDQVSVFGPVFLMAGLVLLADLVITVRTMNETVVPETGPVGGVWKTTFVGVRSTISGVVPRWVVAVLATYGAFNACVELLTPLGLSEGLGSDRAALWFGAIVAGAWLISAFTATRTPQLEGWAGSAARAAGLGTVAMVLLMLPAAFPFWAAPVVAYVGLNTVGGPLLPLLATIIHRHVDSATRSTALSTLNLAFMAGATIGSGLVAVADRASVLLVAAVAVVCGWGLLRAQQRVQAAG